MKQQLLAPFSPSNFRSKETSEGKKGRKNAQNQDSQNGKQGTTPGANVEPGQIETQNTEGHVPTNTKHQDTLCSDLSHSSVVASEALSDFEFESYSSKSIMYQSKEKYVLDAMSKTNDPVIIKVIRSDDCTELEILQHQQHPFISKLLDVQPCKNCSFLGLVFPVYSNYQQRFCATPEENIAQVANCCNQLFVALEHLHEQNIYHGDISRNNVMFDSCSGDVVLIDFGLAGRAPDAGGITFGTYLYTAPELQDKQPFDEKIDVYSAGVLILDWLVFAAHGCVCKSEDECNYMFQSFKVLYPMQRDILDVLVLVIAKCKEPIPNKRLSAKRALQLLESAL